MRFCDMSMDELFYFIYDDADIEEKLAVLMETNPRNVEFDVAAEFFLENLAFFGYDPDVD